MLTVAGIMDISMYLKGFKAFVCPFLKVGEVFLEIGNFPTTCLTVVIRVTRLQPEPDTAPERLVLVIGVLRGWECVECGVEY